MAKAVHRLDGRVDLLAGTASRPAVEPTYCQMDWRLDGLKCLPRRQNGWGVKLASDLYPYAPANAHSLYNIINHPYTRRGRQWRSWLRHCSTSRKDACSNPNEVF